MSNHLCITPAAASSAGLKTENQDAWGFQQPQENIREHKGIAAIVADGVSSADCAGKASETSVLSFMGDYYSTPDSWSVRHSVSRVMSALNSWLHQQSRQDTQGNGSWLTTFSGAIFKGNTGHFIHIGDSRIYRLRHQQLERLTNDHSAPSGGGRTFLARALGMDIHIDIDFQQQALQAEDIYLFSTDGIHDFITESSLLEKLGSGEDLQCIADDLLTTALTNDCDDNATLLLCRIDALPDIKMQEQLQQSQQLPFPPELSPGVTLDDYHILQELHAGPRSQIYLAQSLSNNAIVIIKTPSHNFSDDEDYIASFTREEWIGRRLNHPSLLKIYPPNKQKQFLYHASEYIQGHTLRQWIQRNPNPSVDQVREIIEQIANALRAMHRMEVLHQDLKPDNILIDENGRIKIIDYGSARVAGLTYQHGHPQQQNQQHPMGSKNYSAPETLLNNTSDNRSDLFSLGVIAYEMLCGKLPFKETAGKLVTLKNYQQMRYQSILSHQSDIPLWVDGALKKALSPDPAYRYQSFSEFCYDLTHPNPEFDGANNHKPLLEKNPVKAWKMIALVLLISNVLLLFFLGSK